MAKITITIADQTKPEQRFFDELLTQENTRRANDKLDPYGSIDAYYVDKLEAQIAEGGKNYDISQAQADEDIKSLITVWYDLTNSQRTAVKTAAGI